MKIKFADLESGHSYSAYAMITDVMQKEARNGNPFLNIKLSDGEKEITAVLFDSDMEKFNHKRGDILEFALNVSTYNGTLNFVIKNYREIDSSDEISKSDFILSAPISATTMYSECMDVIKKLKIKNIELGKLVETIYMDYKEQLIYWSAAKSMHHNCYSGLLYHSYRMMKSALALSSVYDGIDEAMVTAGCLLHDIGKINELSTDELGTADYTVDGNLFGHLFMGVEIVKEYAKKLDVDEEITRNLCHIIASHHGNREWGAITPPATMEAFLVSQIDMIDAKMYMYEKAESELAPGEISQTPIIDGTRIYHSANKI